LHRPYFFH